MALVTYQMQGSYATLPSRPSSWSKEMKLKQYVAAFHVVGKTDRCFWLNHNFCLSVGAPHVHGPKIKPLRILAFKGSAQNDEKGGRSSGSKVSKNSVKLPYVPEESEETIIEPPKAHRIPLSYSSEANENIAGSLAIHKLFKKWLTMLRTQTPSLVLDEVMREESPPREISEIQHGTQNKETGQILKMVWSHFWGLDATIKIPLLIFIPWYLAVNVTYGTEVSKELMPLWIFGPVIISLYIKMFRRLCALYLFSFNQTVKVIKNSPAYYLIACNYIAQGKLKEDVRALVWLPLVDIKNLNYKKLSRRKLKELKEWLVERYLDFVESIWPHYCRTIRFLKRANLI